jgi:D-aminoacyl-tRNA deacylase
MRAVIQRCQRAQVEVESQIAGAIGRGLAVFLGVATGDDEACAARLAQKVAALRIFDDEQGKFALSLRDVGGAALVIPNFTICGDARKGTRPNFGDAAAPEPARRLYERFVTLLSSQGVPVQTGVFAASMKVTVENDGPVTIVVNIEP